MLSLSPDDRNAQKLMIKIDTEQATYQRQLAEEKISSAIDEAEKFIKDGQFDQAQDKLRTIVLPVAPDNPMAMKLISAIETGIAMAARRQEVDKAVAEAANAEKAKDIEGAYDLYAQAAEMAREFKLQATYKDLSKTVKDLASQIRAQKLAEAEAVKNEENATRKSVMSMLEQDRFDEADALLRQKLDDPRFQASDILRDLASELPRLRSQALQTAKVKKAEADYAAAIALLKEDKVNEAEAALKKIDSSFSESIASKVERALTQDIPRARSDRERAEGLAQLDKAKSLYDAGDLAQSEKVAQAVRDKYDWAQRRADSLLSRIDRTRTAKANAQEKEVVTQVEDLIKEKKFTQAENFIKQQLAGKFKGSEALEALFAEVGQKREAAAAAEAEARTATEEKARLEAAEAAYASAMQLVEEGKFPQAKTALAKIDTSVSRSIASKVTRALEREIPAEQLARQKALANAELSKADELLKEGNLDEAARIANSVTSKFPESERDAKRILDQVENARNEQVQARVAQVTVEI